MSEFDNADLGVATDSTDGGSTEVTMPDGGGRESAQNSYADEDAQLTRGAWNNDPRFRDKIYPGYKWAREFRPKYEALEKESGTLRSEIELFRQGKHQAFNEHRSRVESESVQARDAYWKEHLGKAGLLDVARQYFERLQRGEATTNEKAEDNAPWKRDLEDVKAQLQAEREERERIAADRMRSDFDSQLTNTVKSLAPHYASNDKAMTIIANRAADFAKADLVPAPTKANPNKMAMRQNFGVYVKAAVEELNEIQKASGVRRPTTPGIKGGAPVAADSRAARQARISAIYDQIAGDE